jgi:hypothetical protein
MLPIRQVTEAIIGSQACPQLVWVDVGWVTARRVAAAMMEPASVTAQLRAERSWESCKAAVSPALGP